VGECRRDRALRTGIRLLGRQFQFGNTVLELPILVLLALKALTQLVGLHSRLVGLVAKIGDLLASLVDRGLSALKMLEVHSSDPELAANCTENVKDGVVPVIVHRTRWLMSNPDGMVRVSLLIAVLTPKVSRTVHVDPSGLSSMNTVSCGVVPDAAVTSTLATAPLRAQPTTDELFPFVVRAAEATTVN
jgi:hypothetical protein